MIMIKSIGQAIENVSVGLVYWKTSHPPARTILVSLSHRYLTETYYGKSIQKIIYKYNSASIHAFVGNKKV